MMQERLKMKDAERIDVGHFASEYMVVDFLSEKNRWPVVKVRNKCGNYSVRS